MAVWKEGLSNVRLENEQKQNKIQKIHTQHHETQQQTLPHQPNNQHSPNPQTFLLFISQNRMVSP